MAKKLILFIIGMMMTIGAVADTWIDSTTGIQWKYTVSGDDSCTCDGSNFSQGNLVIPNKIDGRIVTSICGYAFQSCSGLTSVTIPSSVTSIGYWAFHGCSGLTIADFEGRPPEGFSSAYVSQYVAIRYNAVYEGEWLPVIKACGFTNVAPYVPQNRSGPYAETVDGIKWTYMVIDGETVVSRAQNDVKGGVVIPSVLGGRTVSGVAERAFSQCRGITSVVVPSCVTNVQVDAFVDCTMVRKISFAGAPPTGWFNAIPGAWTKIYYNEECSTAWESALGSVGIEDGVPFRSGAGSESGSSGVYAKLSVTNVVVHYVLNSVQPEIVVPVSPDTGFVTAITEVKSSGAVSVPSEWNDNYPAFTAKFGSDFGKALMKKSGKKDGAGNDMLVWQDFVAGTDPTDENDKFVASITIVDGVPVVSYTPELTEEQKALRLYKTYGKKQLQDVDWTDITDLNGEGKKPYNFFKVTVEMK